jgi:hypothetical protein
MYLIINKYVWVPLQWRNFPRNTYFGIESSWHTRDRARWGVLRRSRGRFNSYLLQLQLYYLLVLHLGPVRTLLFAILVAAEQRGF